MRFLTDSILILTILLSVFALATARIGMTIRTFAVQSFLIAFLPWLVHGGVPGFHQVLLAVGTIAVKVVLIPMYLFRAIRDVAIRRDVAPLIGYGTSLFAGSILVALAFAISASLPVPMHVASTLLLPASLSALLLGLLLLISRSKAVTQVVGYLMLENGIFLFGVSLVVEMPLLVEMGILLDVFVGVFVMGIVIFRINREFDHMDTHNLTALRD
jgi:hydrogenase-4 component E